MPSEIERSKQTWGTLLTLRPFSPTSKFVDMKIEAEISRPIAGRGEVTTRFTFTRMPLTEKMSRSEMLAWLESGRAMLEESSIEAFRIRNLSKRAHRAPRPVKKSAEKPPKKASLGWLVAAGSGRGAKPAKKRAKKARA